MKRFKRRSRHAGLGHTLLEMLLSLVLLSIVMASVGSAVMFASQAVPDDNSAAGSLVADSTLLARIAEDLAAAQFVVEQTDHAVTVVVPDRTGDDLPDRVRYAWSGERGAALFYQLNDEEPVTLVEVMAVFELSYYTVEASQDLPAALYYGSEAMIDAFDSRETGTDTPVNVAAAVGQVMTPKLSADALGFVPTRVDVMVGSSSPKDGQAQVELRGWDGSNLGGTAYASATLGESVLADGSPNWYTLALGSGAIVPSEQGLAMTTVYREGTGDVAALRSIDVSAGILGFGGGTGGLLTSSDGSVWAVNADATLAYRLYGQEVLMLDKSYAVTREHMTQIDVSLQRVAEDRSPVKRAVRLMQAPPMVAGYGQIGFDVDPTTMDLNADGVADWSHDRGEFPSTSLIDGIWVADGLLSFPDKSLLSAEVVRVDARMRSNDTLGPTIYGPYTFNDRSELLPVVTQLRSDGNGGQELVVYNDVSMKTQRLVLSGLPEGLIDVGLTLLPEKEVLSIEINHQAAASVQLDRVADPGTIESAVSFGSSGGVAEFGSVRVQVGGSTETISSDSSLIEINVGEIEINLF